MLKLIFFMEFQTLAEFLAQLYPKEAEIFRKEQRLLRVGKGRTIKYALAI